MSLINWNDQLSVDIKEIDAQHMKLVALINKLHDAMKAGKGKEILSSVLSELLDYTGYHFTHEEKLMQKHNYPGHALHKREHDALTNKVKQLKAQVDRGQSAMTLDVMNFLKEWLTQHIQGSDKHYTPFLKAKGIA